MIESVAVRGVAATEPRHLVPGAGAPVTAFRLVTSGDNWYTVTAFDDLARSVAAKVARGDALVVAGRLCVRDVLGEPAGAMVEIRAEVIGHDVRADPQPAGSRVEA
jgi:single-strand DNA-binding protein